MYCSNTLVNFSSNTRLMLDMVGIVDNIGGTLYAIDGAVPCE